MNLLKTVLAGVAGTTCMTLYSYFTSRKEHEQYREPLLLHEMLGNSSLPDTKKTPLPLRQLDGWLLHFGTGMVFSAAYDRIWKNKQTDPSLAEGMAMGAVSGLVGMAIWSVTFRLHPDPPRVKTGGFYRQLLVAHIIFGAVAALGYRSSETEMGPGDLPAMDWDKKPEITVPWDPGKW